MTENCCDDCRLHERPADHHVTTRSTFLPRGAWSHHRQVDRLHQTGQHSPLLGGSEYLRVVRTGLLSYWFVCFTRTFKVCVAHGFKDIRATVVVASVCDTFTLIVTRSFNGLSLPISLGSPQPTEGLAQLNAGWSRQNVTTRIFSRKHPNRSMPCTISPWLGRLFESEKKPTPPSRYNSERLQKTVFHR